ncbi:hypothetical protein [Sorangium sp. So ce124]|uniref:hypothetical protein n=1 Tax=Sorangium sp. So ce124 TaxID=3133280 RepID=UPI003F627012
MTESQPKPSSGNLRAALLIALGLPLLPAGCLSVVGTNYWLRSREQVVELSPSKVAELSDLPSFVQVRGRAEGGVETTTDNNVLFRVAGYPSVVFSAEGANDRERTIALLKGTEFDGRMYTAEDYSSMAVNQFAERAKMSDARVVRVGETPASQRWHYKLQFGIAGGIMTLALMFAGWILANRSRFTGEPAK